MGPETGAGVSAQDWATYSSTGASDQLEMSQSKRGAEGSTGPSASRTRVESALTADSYQSGQ